MRRLLVDTTPLRIYPEFRRLFFGFTISQMGAQLGIVAISYQVYRVTGSVFDVGLISLVQLAPAFFGAVMGGAIADVMDRRKLLVISELAIVASTAGLALNASYGHGELWLLYVLAALSAGATGVDGPTRTAVLMSIVDSDEFVSANALRQMTTQMATVVGPAIGGVLLGVFGVSVVFWANAGTFAASLATILALHSRPIADSGTRFGLKSIREGFTYLRGRQAMQGCFIADLNTMVLGMPTALFPAIGISYFHGGAKTVGLLYSAPGAGALIASVFSGWTNSIRRPGRAVCFAIALWGFAIAAFGFSHILWLSLILIGIAGGADVISAVMRSTIIQLEATNRLRGRISSIQQAVVTSGPRLGNTEAGGVAALAGLQFSVISGGLGCVVGIALIARLLPGFVRYRIGDHLEVEEIDDEPTGEPATSGA